MLMNADHRILESKMSFCPDWIFDAAVGRAGEEFLSAELPMQALCTKYSKGLSEKYSEIKVEEVTAAVDSILRFLGEVEAGDEAVNFLRGFSYFRLCFEGV